MPNNLPRTNHGGGADRRARSNKVADIDLIRAITEPNVVVFNGSGTATSDPYRTASCEAFTVYVFGTTPDVDVEACMDPQYGNWSLLNASAIGDKSFYAGDGRNHPWIRIVINSGTGVTVHLWRNYPTY